MPPTLKAFALVWPDLHLSLVNFSLLLPLAELEAEGVLELLSLAFDELSEEPQAERARPRTAVPAITLVHVAVVDRFTG